MARQGGSLGGSGIRAGGVRSVSRGPVSFGGAERGGGIRSGPPSRAEYTQARGIIDAATRAGFITPRIGIGENIGPQRSQLSTGIGATSVPGLERRFLRPISIPGGSGTSERRTTVPSSTMGIPEGLRVIPAPPRPGSASRFEAFRPSQTEPTREGPVTAENVLRNSVVFSTTLPQRDVPTSQNVAQTGRQIARDQNRRFEIPTVNNLAVQAIRSSEQALSGRVPPAGRESVRILPDIRRQSPVNPENVPPDNPTRLAPHVIDLPRPPEIAQGQDITEAITRLQHHLQELHVPVAPNVEPRQTGISVVKPAVVADAKIALQQEIATVRSQKTEQLTSAGKARRLSVIREAKRAGLIIPPESKNVVSKLKTNVRNYLEDISIRPLKSWHYIQGGWREVSYAFWGKRTPNGKVVVDYTPQFAVVNGRYHAPQPLEVVPIEDDDLKKRNRKKHVEDTDKKSLRVRLQGGYSAVKLFLTHPNEIPTVHQSILPQPQTEAQVKPDRLTKTQTKLRLVTVPDIATQTHQKTAVAVDIGSSPEPGEKPALRLVPSPELQEKDVQTPIDNEKEKNKKPVTIFESEKRGDIFYIVHKDTKRERVKQVFEGARIAATKFGEFVTGLRVALYAPKFTTESKSPLVRAFKQQDGSELLFWKYIVAMGALPQKAWKNMAEWLVEKFRPVAIQDNKAVNEHEAHMGDVKLVLDDSIKPDVPIAA